MHKQDSLRVNDHFQVSLISQFTFDFPPSVVLKEDFWHGLLQTACVFFHPISTVSEH